MHAFNADGPILNEPDLDKDPLFSSLFNAIGSNTYHVVAREWSLCSNVSLSASVCN